jgi:RNA polymerase sigma factor (sigma-70 family)
MKPSTGSSDNEEWVDRQNPFAQGVPNDSTIPDEELVTKAQTGDRDALERLVRRHQAWVFNIALRMMWRRDLAEDATQEILIKVVTKLSTFRAQSEFRTWLYRIAINHLLNLRKSEIERKLSTFTDLSRALDATPELDLPDPQTVPVEMPLLIHEDQVGCMSRMLLCLERRQRMAFILGEVLASLTMVRRGGHVCEAGWLGGLARSNPSTRCCKCQAAFISACSAVLCSGYRSSRSRTFLCRQWSIASRPASIRRNQPRYSLSMKSRRHTS